jgi:hypothetical protein
VIGDTVSESQRAAFQADMAFKAGKSPDSALIRFRPAENRYKLTSLFLVPGVVCLPPSVFLLVKSIQFYTTLMDDLNHPQNEAPGIDILFLVAAMGGIVLGATGIIGSAGCIVAGTISIMEYGKCRKKELQLKVRLDFPLRR